MRDIVALDQFEFHSTLARTPGVSLILFSHHGCSACRRWKQLLGNYLDSGVELTIFEVDVQRDQALAREFEVCRLPALFLFRQGQFHCTLESEPQLGSLDHALHRALALPAQEPP